MSLNGSQRSIVASSVAWMDTYFDADTQLLRHPGDLRRHAVRESLWYAAGLLVQGRDEAALRIVDTVLALQFDRPGAVWDGTWPRAPEEPNPEDGAVIWRDYDPNWRQFIGCLLGVLIRDYADALGSARCERAGEAIARALRGEPADRIVPSYSNIALMQAWLLCEYGDRSRGEGLAMGVERLYRSEGGFSEFNSPTYYGVDLWGLALWRDTAQFYHPGMRNLCGPYDRAYGMDMTRYVSLLGLWLWWTCGDAARAFPDLRRRFEHAHDFCAAPLLALAPPSISDEARTALLTPVAICTVQRRLAGRTISAVLCSDLMLGAVDRAYHDATGQAMPITAHWFDADGRVAWLCIRGELSGVVKENCIVVRSSAELSLRCSAYGNDAFGSAAWTIGGRQIEVTGTEVGPAQRRSNQLRCALKLPSGEAILRFA